SQLICIFLSHTCRPLAYNNSASVSIYSRVLVCPTETHTYKFVLTRHVTDDPRNHNYRRVLVSSLAIMSGEAWLYLIAVLINAVNLFLQVFFTIMYSDLECDYINPIDLCNRLNTYIVPEAAVHAFITILFLVNGYWIALILNLPLLAWNAKKIFENQHLLDATEIFRKLNVHKKASSCAASYQACSQLTIPSGILHQAWLPPRHVLLLPLQHDRRPYPRRVALNCCYQTTPINSLPTSDALPKRHRTYGSLFFYT
ncbi:hypothetical protein E4T51_06964, partial [Aureobasidium sp. EXF-12344]